MSAGHPDARSYTIGMLIDEASIVDARESRRLADTMDLFQRAISTQPVELSKGGIRLAKKVSGHFQDALKTLRGG